MIIRITQDTRIKSLQEKFRREFPFLKLGVIDFSYVPENGARTGRNKNPFISIFPQAGKEVTEGILKIHPWSKTATVEKGFEDLGLLVRIMRRTAYTWMRTTETNELSLEEQNELGRRSVAHYRNSLWMERETLL